jgi:membrane-associated protease RseP (regulator of RpoE activity)
MSSRDEWRFPPPSGPPRSQPSASASAAPDPAPGPAVEEAEESEREYEPTRRRPWWILNIGLFLATVYSVFEVGQMWSGTSEVPGFRGWASGWPFAVPLLTILVCHEFGHYIAARLHRVPASLPYFIPLPKVSPFGTFGAVIVMPRRIRSANALLDIGAAGPLAGMVVAIPMMIWGLHLSHLGPRGDANYIQEGQSLLYWLLKRVMFGPIAPDQDVMVHPTALAAWAGFLVTFLNLLPFGQLDGGHVAYALLGQRQNRVARWMHFVPLLLIVYNAWVYVRPFVNRGRALGFGSLPAGAWLPVSAVTVWIGIFVLLSVMRRFSGVDHPPVDHAALSPVRKIVAVVTLGLFVLLFMPSPWVAF